MYSGRLVVTCNNEHWKQNDVMVNIFYSEEKQALIYNVLIMINTNSSSVE